MRDFDPFDIVRVPFPFSDRAARKNRPALILSGTAFSRPAGHAVMAMITSAANPPWPEDCLLLDLALAGLPAPSKVRFKLFTLDLRLVSGALGHLSARDELAVRETFSRVFHWEERRPRYVNESGR